MAHSPKSGTKSGNRPGTFTADDPRRGRGPAKGAPNAGRPPEWIKRAMLTQRETAVEQVAELLEQKAVEPKLLLQIVKEFAPETEGRVGAKVTVSPDGTVVLDLGSA